MRISSCRGCGADETSLSKVFALEPCPVAGVSYAAREDALVAPLLPLTWASCARCGLVQVMEDVPDDVLYGGRYHYVSSQVRSLGAHFDDLASEIRAIFSGGSLLEIGCNDGILLSRLPPEWDLWGIDPSDVARDAAGVGRWRFIHGHFPDDLPRSGLQFDFITSSNCFAHISDLGRVFDAAAQALKLGGKLLIEVHALEVLLAEGQWDPIYHEHKAEWSEAALSNCARLAGLKLVSCRTVPAQGGSHRAIFVRDPGSALNVPFRVPPAPAEYEKLRTAYVQRRAAPVYTQVMAALDSGRTVAAYGASARGSVWLHQHPELAARLGYVVDGSPIRQRRYLGGSGLAMVSPDYFRAIPPDVCLITAWNFAKVIKEQHPEFSGAWLQTFEDPK